MDFQLYNVDLTEAQLYRSTAQFRTLTGRDVANLLYLNTLSLALMYLTEDTHEVARNYAGKTAQYGTYALFRTSATDIYMLAYQVKNPDNDYATMKDPIASKKFLNRLNFDSRKHVAIMRRIQTGGAQGNELHSYLMRMEAQAGITDSRYKTWRREVGTWDKASESRRSKVIRDINREFARIGGGSVRRGEIQQALNTGKNRITVDKPKKPSMARKLGGAAAGAAAGSYVAGKLNKSKKAGAGIGAIAGYWAAGRNSK